MAYMNVNKVSGLPIKPITPMKFRISLTVKHCQTNYPRIILLTDDKHPEAQKIVVKYRMTLETRGVYKSTTGKGFKSPVVSSCHLVEWGSEKIALWEKKNWGESWVWGYLKIQKLSRKMEVLNPTDGEVLNLGEWTKCWINVWRLLTNCVF